MRGLFVGALALALCGCGAFEDEDDGDSGSGGGDGCTSRGPVCNLLIDADMTKAGETLLGQPLTKFEADGKDADSTENQVTSFGLFFTEDVAGDGNVDMGDTLKICPTSRSVESIIPDVGNVQASLSYVIGENSLFGVWDGLCKDGTTLKFSEKS